MNTPPTPSRDRHGLREAERARRLLQMTPPDDRRSRSRSHTPPSPGPIPQLNLFVAAADIPQVHIPDDLDAPMLHPMPYIPPAPVRNGRYRAQAIPAALQGRSFIDLRDPEGYIPPAPAPLLASISGGVYGVPFTAPVVIAGDVFGAIVPLGPNIDVDIAPPIQNSERSHTPPSPFRRGREQPVRPLNDISGGQADPALNHIHRGHIASRESSASLREQRALNNNAAHIENILQQQAIAGHLQRQPSLQRHADELRQQNVDALQRDVDNRQAYAAQHQGHNPAAPEPNYADGLHQPHNAAFFHREQLERERDARDALERGRMLQIYQQRMRQEQDREDEEILQNREQHERLLAQMHLAAHQQQLADQTSAYELDRMSAHQFHQSQINQNYMRQEEEEEEEEDIAAHVNQQQNAVAVALSAAIAALTALGAEPLPPDITDNTDPHAIAAAALDSALAYLAALTSQDDNHNAFRPSNSTRDPDPSEPPPPTFAARIATATRNARQYLHKARRTYEDPVTRHYLGAMDTLCPKCGALHFDSEKLTSSTLAENKFGTCCLKGQIDLPEWPSPPRELNELFSLESPLAKEFKKYIRQYNAALAFTSLGVKIDHAVTDGAGPYCFKIHGELHHLAGSLIPPEGIEPSYAQLYIYDPAEALDIRSRRNTNLRQDVMSELQAMLLEHHPYVALYKQAHTIMLEKPADERHHLNVRLRVETDADGRVYNLPSVEEIAAVIPGDGSEDRMNDRDVIVRLVGGALKRMSHLHPDYSTLHYVLLFPRGEEGWHTRIPSKPPTTGNPRSPYVSERCYYAYRLHTRPGVQPILFHGGKLLQQYIVDAWASIEQSMLNWVRFNQKKIRSDLYQGLRDAVVNEDVNNPVVLAGVGRRIILPSSHSGSARYMHQLFQDSMAICRALRKPDLFLTMTANPKWPEIKDNLFEGQEVTDRPDIVTRVFELKKKALLKEIKEHGIFGKTVGMVHTIEFQKRGLPHMHLLIFLDPVDKIRDPIDIDSIVSAQIPNPVTHPMLYETVTTCMMHGPCGPRCQVNGICSKNYPKDFCEVTKFTENSYPEYARPNNGRSFTKGSDTYTNRDVVPYNPYLSAKYGCHINVEICASIEAIKYIHKYIYKGHDRTTIEISGEEGAPLERDEIKEHLDARYISAIESCWRISEFSMHAESPTVYRLPVHLPHEQTIYFNEDDNPEEVLERANSKTTALLCWFEANVKYPEARAISYQDFPGKFVYSAKKKAWAPRQRGPPAIGRMYMASPSSGERFYLRTLLTVVKGATSFADLRKVNDVQYDTFKDACKALGLLEDDNEWIQCLREAGELQTGSALRSLFATVLLSCNPTSPSDLWTQFKHQICDDLRRQLERFPRYAGGVEISQEDVYDYGLHLIDKILIDSGKRLSSFPPMPLPLLEWDVIANNYLLWEQTAAFDQAALAATVANNCARFNPEQQETFDVVMDSVNNNKGKLLFVHSAGGGGKTFVCNTIAAAVRAQNKAALCVASSGIASLLLEGGRTSHSCFKIPIPVFEDSSCNIKRNSDLHKVLQETGIIIWDEVPMQHKHTLEAVDHTLQDLLGSNAPFGGITVLFGGDFRQTLPVVPKGSRQEIIASSLCRSSKLWPLITLLNLHQNMRLDRTAESDTFAAWLLTVGAGTNLASDEMIELPHAMRCGNNTESLIESTYPGISQGNMPDQYYLDRTLLSCTNDDVDGLNTDILAKLPGEEQVLMGADTVVTDNEANFAPYPMEFLNSIKASGLPLAKLALKPGCPLMLLRNIEPSKGLCNGSRMILIGIRPRVLQCRVITGDARFTGSTVFIPRMTLEPSGESLPLALRRRQFPVRLAFAMTVNKSQGQSVKNIGLDLRSPVFSHGQLYVALSRCTSGNRIKVLFPLGQTHNKTKNIVYREILQAIRL